MRRQTRALVLTVVLVAGAVAGSILGSALEGVVPILSRGFTIGLEPPLVLDLNVVGLTLGFTLHLNLLGALTVLLLVLLLGR